MHLKRLEIIGFKSFPDKCVIDFPPGISSIVGPNGCGKSNIIDAIKWVMGEQSIKQLRGKSMGDVIFSGTQKRLQLNMAEVSLTLSNDTPETTEKTGLSMLTEIMITRRLFRSGESAYLINKQPCRLKDIHNVFLGSGMGAKSCAIVQQGNIGAITDTAPEDRRAYIEEAAGVSRYKTRKNEAISKLNSTHQNLLRLNDIIDEIKKQMNSLRRQARKALRYKDFRDGLKKSDILVSVYYHELYTSQITNTQNLLSELKEKDASHASELKKLNAALDKIRADRFSKDQIISQKKSKKSDAERRIDQLKNDLKYLRGEEKRLSDEVSGLDTAIINIEAKNQKINDEIAEESAKIKNLSAQIEESKIALSEKASETTEVRKQLLALQKTLEEQKTQLMRLMAQKAKFQNIFKNAESNKENLRQRINQIKKDETDFSKKIAKLEKTVSAVDENRKSIHDASESLKRRISEKKTLLDDQSTQLGNQIKTVNKLINDRNKVKSEYTALKKMDDNYEWYKDGVKAVMKQHQIDKGVTSAPDIGIIGITADGVEPELGFEIALEAALGESLQYIVIKDQETGIASINSLKKSKTGRSGFIPVLALSEPGKDQLQLKPGAPLLTNHVRIKSGYEAIFSELLQGIAVAEDFDEALEIRARKNGCHKVVTKSGDIILSNGIMVGGSEDKLSGIYKKKLALKQLTNQLAELDSTIETDQKIQKDLESSVKQLESEIQKLTVQKNTFEKEILEAEKQHFQASENLKHTLSRYEIITLEKEKLLGEKADIEDEIAAHDAALAEITCNEESAELQITEISARITSLSEQMNDFNQSEMDLKLSLTRLNAEIENSKKTLHRLQEYEAEGLRQNEQIKKDIIIKTQKSRQAATEISEADKKLAETIDGLNSINIDLQNHDADYQNIISEISKTDETINQTQSIIDEVQDKLHQLELELSGFKLKRENVVNRFLDRYSQSFSQSLAENRNTVQSEAFSIEKTETALASYRKKMDRIGDVNLGAIEAYEEQKTRHEFLIQQRDDLLKAIEDLQRVIKKINRITQKLFIEMFHNINEQFKAMFPRLFEGGSAWLELTHPNNPLESGVELMIHPPGKKVTRLSLLSGGEKALSAIAFIFSIFLINPASYCLLDEIDAPLDEANTNRFNELLKIIGEKSQIIMISHNKRSMAFSDMLFGVTMSENGVSKLVSVDIEQLATHPHARN